MEEKTESTPAEAPKESPLLLPTAPALVAPDGKTEISTKPKEIKLPAMQHCIVSFADGRRGVFAGPEVISAEELKNNPPRLVSIDFSEPRQMGVVAPEEKPAETPAAETPAQVPAEEVPNAEQSDKSQGNS